MRTLSQRLPGLIALLLAPLLATAQPVLLPPAPEASYEAHAPLVGARQPCTNGTAAGFGCAAIDLMAFVPIADLGGATNAGAASSAELNDIWGWTDPTTGKEYALVGRTDGTAFVDISDPINPAFLGLLPRPPGVNPSSWRDLKVDGDHVFIVSEATGHGMQVFDLTALRGLTASPTRLFSETARYTGISSAHNIVVNEETGFAYAVGSRASTGGPACGRGLHMIDVRIPAQPTFAGCFTDPTTGRSGNGYTHDAQCVVYRGPDARFTGREVCFAANETAISIADVTDKASPQKLSALSYPAVAYTHQGWLSEDQRYFFVDDELDERNGLVAKTRTLVFDVSALDSPELINQHAGVTGSIDHNQYVVGRYTFQANYTSGLRVLDVADPAHLTEVAFFDTYPSSDAPQFAGLWSVYPFFRSRNVVVSDIGQGLFVLRPTALQDSNTPVTPPDALPDNFSLHATSSFASTTARFTLKVPGTQRIRVSAFDATGRLVSVLSDERRAAGVYPLTLDVSQLASGVYFVQAFTGTATRTASIVVLR